MALTITVIDDDPSLLAMTKASLATLLTAEVRALPGAKEALEALPKLPPPNILIVDYMMPQVDGLSFVGTLLTTPGWDKTCIIMLSAVGSNIRAAALKQRVYAMVDKPIKPIMLAQTVAGIWEAYSKGQPSPLEETVNAAAAAKAASAPLKK